jgi:hypothetical protein
MSKDVFEKSLAQSKSIHQRLQAMKAASANWTDADKEELDFMSNFVDELLLGFECYSYEIPSSHMDGCLAQFQMSILT